MSEITESADLTVGNEQREVYVVMVTYIAPGQGSINIAARDADHAKEVVIDYLKQYTDVNIVDCYKLDTVKMPAVEGPNPFEETYEDDDEDDEYVIDGEDNVYKFPGNKEIN